MSAFHSTSYFDLRTLCQRRKPQICWCGSHIAIYIFWNGYDVENVTYGTILWCKKLKFNLYPNAKRKFKVYKKKCSLSLQSHESDIWCWMVLLTQSHIARHEAAIHAAARCRFAFTQLTVHVRCLSCYVLSPPSCPIVQRSKEHSRQNSPKWEVKSPRTFSFGPGSQSLTISVQFWRLSFWYNKYFTPEPKIKFWPSVLCKFLWQE